MKDRLIFIGVKSHNNDLHYTPYSNGKQTERESGVIVHAQATSQIISAVLDNRQLIKWLPNGLESIWIMFWAIAGSAVVFIYCAIN